MTHRDQLYSHKFEVDKRLMRSVRRMATDTNKSCKGVVLTCLEFADFILAHADSGVVARNNKKGLQRNLFLGGGIEIDDSVDGLSGGTTMVLSNGVKERMKRLIRVRFGKTEMAVLKRSISLLSDLTENIDDSWNVEKLSASDGIQYEVLIEKVSQFGILRDPSISEEFKNLVLLKGVDPEESIRMSDPDAADGLVRNLIEYFVDDRIPHEKKLEFVRLYWAHEHEDRDAIIYYYKCFVDCPDPLNDIFVPVNTTPWQSGVPSFVE